MPFDQRPEGLLDHPTQMQPGLGFAKCTGERPRVDDVAKGGEADEDDPHSTHPFEFRISNFEFAITRPRNFGFRISDLPPDTPTRNKALSDVSPASEGGREKSQNSKIKTQN
jgi:hypothetical protein